MPIPALLLLSLAGGNAVALASPSSSSSPAREATSPFCQKGVIFAKSGPSTTITTVSPATLKADYAKFKAAQPTMLSLAPSSIKGALQKIFAFDDGLFEALSKVGWSMAKLPPSELQSLAVKGPALRPASDKVIAYLDKTCGLKFPLP
jgi:hypothetical protein